MKLLEYIDLIKTFAANDPDLLHTDAMPAVYSRTYEDAVPLLSSIPDRMVLMVPPYGKNVVDNAAMGNVWVKRGLVVALQYVSQDDFDSQVIIQDKAEQVLDRLYTFLFERRNTVALYGFNPRSWECDGIGPIAGNHFGFMAEFEIKDGVVL